MEPKSSKIALWDLWEALCRKHLAWTLPGYALDPPNVAQVPPNPFPNLAKIDQKSDKTTNEISRRFSNGILRRNRPKMLNFLSLFGGFRR